MTNLYHLRAIQSRNGFPHEHAFRRRTITNSTKSESTSHAALHLFLFPRKFLICFYNSRLERTERTNDERHLRVQRSVHFSLRRRRFRCCCLIASRYQCAAACFFFFFLSRMLLTMYEHQMVTRDMIIPSSSSSLLRRRRRAGHSFFFVERV